jgi:hypothetical protein
MNCSLHIIVDNRHKYIDNVAHSVSFVIEDLAQNASFVVENVTQSGCFCC